MTHTEILCYAIAHIDHLKDDLTEKRMRFAGKPDMQLGINNMIADLDAKKEQLKILYTIECGSEYSE